MQVGVVGDNGTVGIGHQASISVSISLTLSEVVVASVVVWAGVHLGGQMGSSCDLVGRVNGHNSAVGVVHQAGISVSISLTLSEVVVASVVVWAGVRLGGQMGSSCDLVGRVNGHNSAVGVVHQTGTSVADNAKEGQVVEHGCSQGCSWLISPECVPM